ncbi:hypothetical protein EV426DRAFT_642655 [Tirmania nivea]|nr:hypothetical protein EV426DRAFT_642655 [Tirmania nivea]
MLCPNNINTQPTPPPRIDPTMPKRKKTPSSILVHHFPVSKDNDTSNHDMPSRGYIRVKHADHRKKNRGMRKESSIGQPPPRPLQGREKESAYNGEFHFIKIEEELSCDRERSELPKEVFKGCKQVANKELNAPMAAVVESPKPPTDNKEEDEIKQAWQYYKEHRLTHWSFCQDFYCKTHGSHNQLRNRFFDKTICSVCGLEGHGVLVCELLEKVTNVQRAYLLLANSQLDGMEKRNPLCLYSKKGKHNSPDAA